MEWTQENIDILTQMWRNGFTARQIAFKLGQGVTRNAIIGKAHRMGLSQRPQQAKKREGIEPVKLGIMKECQWPHGDPTSMDFRYCGAPVEPGRPYFSEHCQIAYRRVYTDSSGQVVTTAIKTTKSKEPVA